MALNESEKRELAELEELDMLEQRYGEPKAGLLDRFGQKLSGAAKSVTGGIRSAGESLLEGGQDAGLGFVQGSTMGGADEASGGMSVLYDLAQQGLNKIGLADESPMQVNERLKAQGFTGDIGPTDLTGVYREGQESAEKMYKEAEERSPWLYTGGQLAGAIGSGLATGGLANAALAKAGIQTGGKLAAKEILKQGGKKALAKQIGKRALTLGAIGGIEGGIAGGLMSENDLIGASSEEQDRLLGDVGSGVLTGNILGAGISVAGDVAPIAYQKGKEAIGKKISDIVDSKEYLRVLRKAQDYGQAGINIGEEANFYGRGKTGVNLSNVSGKHAEDLMNKLISTDETLGQQVGRTLDAATSNGVTINLDPQIISSYRQIMDIANKQNLLLGMEGADEIAEKVFASPSTVKPNDARLVMEKMDEILNSLSGDPSPSSRILRGFVGKFREGVRRKLGEAVPSYNEAAKDFYTFRQKIVEPFLRKDVPEEFSDVMYGKLNNKQEKLFKAIRDTFERGTREGVVTRPSKTIIAELNKNLSELAKQGNTKLLSGIDATDPEAFMKGFLDKSDEANMLYRAVRHNPNVGEGTMIKRSFLGADALVHGFNKKGLYDASGPGIVSKSVSAPVNLGKKLFNLTDQGYQQLAQRLNVNPSTSKYGQALIDAVQNNDIAKRNAILFSLMQTPAFRSELEDDK